MTQNNTYDIIVKTSFGLEDVLTKELNDLGINNTTKLNRAVRFKGDLKSVYLCNLALRTANKILVVLNEFKIYSANDFYFTAKKMAWDEIFSIHQTFAVEHVVKSSFFKNTQFASLKLKDAIVDKFRSKYNKRPNVDTNSPDFKINLHIMEDYCTISLDTSNIPLFKRGYRTEVFPATLKEDLAAGMVLLSEWNKTDDFIDLFCGSGTLLIEAAMIAYNIFPNINRSFFGFMNWKNFDKHLFETVKNELNSKAIKFKGKILGLDIDRRAVTIARKNINNAGLHGKIEVINKNFRSFTPSAQNGFIVSNPPYGLRLGNEDEMIDLYQSIGDFLKQKCSGYIAWILSGNLKALKRVGLKPSKKINLFNGNIPCGFYKFEMYEGTKKQKNK